MEEPDFWDKPEQSQQMMKELSSLKEDRDTYQSLKSQMEDMETLIEMGYEENDPSVIPEIQELLEQFESDFENIRMKTLLSGEYDRSDAIPVTGRACCTGCTAGGRRRRDLPWRFWTIWTATRRASSP